MSKSTDELDFFGLKKGAGKSSSLDQRISIRGIQRAISRINPQVLKSVIASGSPKSPAGASAAVWNASSPSASPTTPLPVLNLASSAPGTAPLTIFYNGTVAVYDLPKNKAEDILRLAKDMSELRSGPATTTDRCRN